MSSSLFEQKSCDNVFKRRRSLSFDSNYRITMRYAKKIVGNEKIVGKSASVTPPINLLTAHMVSDALHQMRKKKCVQKQLQ